MVIRCEMERSVSKEPWCKILHFIEFGKVGAANLGDPTSDLKNTHARNVLWCVFGMDSREALTEYGKKCVS